MECERIQQLLCPDKRITGTADTESSCRVGIRSCVWETLGKAVPLPAIEVLAVVAPDLLYRRHYGGGGGCALSRGSRLLQPLV